MNRAPLLGVHNRIALESWLDLSAQDVVDLHRRQVLEQDSLVEALQVACEL